MNKRAGVVELRRLQNEVLEKIASGEDLVPTLDFLCRRVEAVFVSVRCSILSVDASGALHPLAAPSLPDDFSRSIDGVSIGPKAGSCGTAAYRREAVEVVDIATDPLWAGFSHLALRHGLRACWSSPIMARDGRVIGTFAFYYDEPRAPRDAERRIVETCSHLCSIAIEHDAIQSRNRFMAYHDGLTGLANRAAFREDIQRFLAKPHFAFALLLIDLDHLKHVNDTLGHAAGDVLINSVAERLIEAVPEGAKTYRLGGDEFAVVLPGCSEAGQMTEVAADIKQMIGRSLHHDRFDMTAHASIGGVLRGCDGDDMDTLCQNADFALYHAKEASRGGFVPFERGMRTTITGRLQTIAEVDEALRDERLTAFYQPVVKLDTTEIVGVEALVRMRRRDGSLAMAGEFFAAFSDPRIAYEITDRMMRSIAADIRSWLDRGIPFQHVGLNVTTADFIRGDLEERLAEIFWAQRVPLRHVILEVTETVFMDREAKAVADTVRRLRAQGTLVALDDFGTGYGSLTHLLDLPVDIIKIDRSFIRRLIDERDSMVIVAGLLDIAAKLGKRVVAEGIETRAQAERLKAMGCVMGQGYHFAVPGPVGVTTALLESFAQGGRASRPTQSLRPGRSTSRL
jgi:diguanylate cyclase (GGDEF)-like protein